MSRAGVLWFCAVALPSAACTRVFDAVTPGGPVTVCAQQSMDPDCQPTPWPTTDGMHKANSDPWLVTHNQVITVMKPTVLVLNFDPTKTSTDTYNYALKIGAALEAGSTYHGYSDPSAQPFLMYNILPTNVIDLTSVAPPTVGTSLVLDPTALFTDPSYPARYGYPDGNGGYLSLCQLFDNGIVNEVWIQDGGDAQTTARAPLYAEQKQIYDDDGLAMHGDFQHTTGGFIGGSADFALNVSCKVTVRLAHLDPSDSGGPGCDVMVRGYGIEGMWSALPTKLATDAYAFLNHDFNTTFGLTGPGWPEICNGADPCVKYPGSTHAASDTASPVSFDVPNFFQGCGNVQFPPNATHSYDFDDGTAVESRCAGFGLGDGNDTYAIYPPADQSITTYDTTYTGNSRSCPAGWQIYWRQSMPGYQNQATLTVDGSPMPNWWPMLFY